MPRDADDRRSIGKVGVGDAAVAAFDPMLLDVIPKGSKLSNLRVIAGVALHDVYHAGQIALLKRLAAGQE